MSWLECLPPEQTCQNGSQSFERIHSFHGIEKVNLFVSVMDWHVWGFRITKSLVVLTAGRGDPCAKHETHSACQAQYLLESQNSQGESAEVSGPLHPVHVPNALPGTNESRPPARARHSRHRPPCRLATYGSAPLQTKVQGGGPRRFSIFSSLYVSLCT